VAETPAEPAERDGLQAQPDPHACAYCGAALADDQEWCIECGAARTLIHRAPDWRIPLLVLGTVIVLAAAVFAIVLINLSHTTGPTGPTPPTAAARGASATPTGKSSAATTGSRAFAPWPAGLSGWTVVLSAAAGQDAADTTATQLSAGGLKVGVLDAATHPAMRSADWMVYLDRYPDEAQAQAAATHLIAEGHTGAAAREVAPPGGV
jgi:hypothetical protein